MERPLNVVRNNYKYLQMSQDDVRVNRERVKYTRGDRVVVVVSV